MLNSFYRTDVSKKAFYGPFDEVNCQISLLQKYHQKKYEHLRLRLEKTKIILQYYTSLGMCKKRGKHYLRA